MTRRIGAASGRMTEVAGRLQSRQRRRYLSAHHWPLPMYPKLNRTASPLDLIDSEIIQEQAFALGRLGRGLEAALATLRDFDAALLSPPTDAARTQRAALVAQAGYALWMFVVLRPARQPRRHARLSGAVRGAGPHGSATASTSTGKAAPRRVAILLPPRLRGGPGWGRGRATRCSGKQEPHPALPEDGEGKGSAPDPKRPSISAPYPTQA
jgi:hypothetical protein